MFAEIFKKFDWLRQQRPEAVFCHCSLKGAGLAWHQAPVFIEELLDFLGPECTLVTPSLTFANHAGYIQMVSACITYDVKKTPARVNLFAETFRRIKTRKVVRSLNPLYPSAAAGKLAQDILSESHLDAYPFDKRTAFGKMLAYRSYAMGIGVDMRTNAFIHMADDKYKDAYALDIYSRQPVKADIFEDGKHVDTRHYYYVNPELRKRIRPDKMMDFLEHKAFFQFFRDPFPGYMLELGPFVELCSEMAQNAVSRGRMPVWLS